MKSIKYIIIFIFIITKFYSQNLVPNPSFEIIDTCGLNSFGSGGVKAGYVPPWDSPTDGSPDLFNTCAQNVPNNYWGYQYPHSGNGYVGSVFWRWLTSREYIQVKLDSDLIANQIYCVSFYVNLGNNFKFACNNFGMYFSNNHVDITGGGALQLNFTPQINDTIIVSDTINWKIIYGQYTALGGEKYIIIGNFYSNALTDTTLLNGALDYAYYYMDDINVHCCTCDSLDHTVIKELPKNMEGFKLYPNPNNGNMTISYKIEGCELAELSIYDMTGRIVKRQMLNAQNSIELIDAAELNSGVYYYVIKEGNRNVKTEKLVIVK